MKVYVAGKITGLTHEEYCAKFAAKRHELEARGYKVMIPVDINATDGFEHSDYMHVCYAMIDVCDAVYMLPDWKESKGARMELQYAADHRKKIFYADETTREPGFPIMYGHPADDWEEWKKECNFPAGRCI